MGFEYCNHCVLDTNFRRENSLELTIIFKGIRFEKLFAGPLGRVSSSIAVLRRCIEKKVSGNTTEIVNLSVQYDNQR